MAHTQLTRSYKALTLVPLAVVCGLWTASIVGLGGMGGSATAGSEAPADGSLPDGTTVPSKVIQAPANVPIPGVIAPGVPRGSASSIVVSASASGIPSAALSAYQRAAQIIDRADKTCRIRWQLIAAIGRVESDHGRFGGNVLTAKGVSVPGIYGPRLDGRNGTTEIRDTDGGTLDKDTTFDRAVGPMQFLPSTWQAVKVDADGDGRRNPQDIDDASLATAVYLCSGGENLGTRAGQEKAVFRYNHSKQYVDLVLRIMVAYQSGDYTALPEGTSGGSVFSPHSVDQGRFGSGGTSSDKPPAKGGSAPGGGSSSGGSSSSGGGSSSSGGVPSSSPDAGMSRSTATTYCTARLSSAIKAGVPGAVSTCAAQLTGKTTAQADGLIAGIIADLTAQLGS